jgi:hypothetical protein
MLGTKDEDAGISPVLSAVRIFLPYEVPRQARKRIHLATTCYGSCRYLEAQPCQLGLDPLLTPQAIFSGHASDETLKLLGNRVATGPHRGHRRCSTNICWRRQRFSAINKALGLKIAAMAHSRSRNTVPPAVVVVAGAFQ